MSKSEVADLRLFAQFHAALFHMLCFFYQDPRSVIMLRLATHKLHSLCKENYNEALTSGGGRLSVKYVVAYLLFILRSRESD